MVENGGNASKALREAGYSESIATNPQKVTNSDSFQRLMDKYLPEKKLLKVAQEGLGAHKYVQAIVGRDEDGKLEYELVPKPDHAIRHSYLETGLKLRGRLQQNNIFTGPVMVPVIINRGEPRGDSADTTA